MDLKQYIIKHVKLNIPLETLAILSDNIDEYIANVLIEVIGDSLPIIDTSRYNTMGNLIEVEVKQRLVAKAMEYGYRGMSNNIIKSILEEYARHLNIKKVIFLDIDGVLNILSDSYRTLTRGRSHDMDEHLVSRLNWVMSMTDLHIVISSSWKSHMHDVYDVLLERGFKYNHRIIGRTPFSGEETVDPIGLRGNQILQYLEEHSHIEEYYVIDDEMVGINCERHGTIIDEDLLIRVDMNEGLTHKNVNLIVSKVNKTVEIWDDTCTVISLLALGRIVQVSQRKEYSEFCKSELVEYGSMSESIFSILWKVLSESVHWGDTPMVVDYIRDTKEFRDKGLRTLGLHRMYGDIRDRGVLKTAHEKISKLLDSMMEGEKK